MSQITAHDAIGQALAEEMRRDERVVLFGEGVATKRADLAREFGTERVRNTPLAEAIIAGTAVGAAASGLRPVVDLLFAPFLAYSMDALVNSAGKLRYLSGGQFEFPMVAIAMTGAGWSVGGQHNHNLEAMFVHAPGLKVVMPSSIADLEGLLKAAIRDDNPVIFVEHETLYGMRGEVPDDPDHVLEFGRCAVRREGGDVTIVGILKMAHEAERAAEALAAEHGVEAEVIDPRTLRPLDLDTILESVRKTNRAVIVEEGWPHGGVGANLAALIQEQAFDHLDAPVQRVTGADVPMPYSKRLEQSAIPHPEHIVSATLNTMVGAGDG